MELPDAGDALDALGLQAHGDPFARSDGRTRGELLEQGNLVQDLVRAIHLDVLAQLDALAGGVGDLRGADTQIDTSCVGMIGADHGIFRGASRPGAFGNRRPRRRGEI